MAKVTGPDFVLFDAATQYEGWNFRDNATPGVFTEKFYVKDIIAYGGASGGTLALHESSGGRKVLDTIELAANEEQAFPVNRWVDGLYVTTLDSGVTVQANLGYY